MPERDSRGLPISTVCDEAASLYREGVDLLLSAWPGAGEALDAAIAADPAFALAHAARARLHAVRAESAEAGARIETAQTAVARAGTERERSHVRTLELAVAGRSREALRQALAHLDAWPQDALIFSLPLGAFGLFAFSGMADHDQARVDLCERHAGSFEADDWWFLTYRGWSHAENGDPARGRDLVGRALHLRRRNANAAHALAHALYESGAHDEAEKLVADWLPDYDRGGVLHGHIAWHAALGALERGDAQAALALYASHIQPSVSAGMPVNVMSDAASLLWRLDAYGHRAPAGLWDAAASYAAPLFPKAGFPFVDVHMAILAAATGDHAGLERRIADLARLAEAGELAAGYVVPTICRAALAFAASDYAGCASLLEPAAADVARIGGSGAQREMIEDMLLLAFMRSGASDKARRLLDLRLHRRPSSRDALWRSQVAA